MRAILVMLTLALPAAGPVRLTSGPLQVGLLELYTSEGCSSCPPADAFFSSLSASPRLWRDVVPVAFHVDYWNDLGWTDRFATPAYSERQREQVRQAAASTVYTPGLFLNGREWRRPSGTATLHLPKAGTAGELTLEVQGGTAVDLWFVPDQAIRGPLLANIALLGSGLVTPVKAGENRGRTLRHDFVVLQLETARLHRDGERYVTTLKLMPAGSEARRRAVAAWVTTEGSLRPLQAAGGWLD